MKYEYRVDDFMEFLYQSTVRDNPLELCGKDEFYRLKEEKRKKLKKILGLDTLYDLRQHYAFEPSVRVVAEDTAFGFGVQHLAMEVLPKLTVPACIVHTKKASQKAVLYCHGHGEGGFYDCIDENSKDAYHKNIPIKLAERGYTVFMFEPVAFGDLVLENYDSKEVSSCFSLTTNLSLFGITTLGLRIFEALTLADYMKKNAFPMYATLGISGGGTCASFLNAVDDGSVANVISCYANLFKTYIMQMHHCIDNFVPNILSIGEMPHVISLCAPKKLFITAGTQDPIFPLEGTQKAVAILSAIYQKLGHTDNFGYDYFEGEHEFDLGFIDWLDKTVFME